MTFTMNNTDDRKWEILSTEYLIRRPWLTEEEVKALLERDEMRQALMAAPLWKYFSMKK
jgi:hypothetical protein